MAFFVLHSVMLKSKNDALCAVVLDAVTAVFDRDPANYFITEVRRLEIISMYLP